MLRVLIRGIGDVGSAVGHRLFQEGYAVVIHDGPRPTTTRRGMAFAEAIFDGRARLEGVEAVRVDDLDDLRARLSDRSSIVVTTHALPSVLQAIAPDILIDARMQKRQHPESQRGSARLTIGLGPNFFAGETTDLAVETSWGDHLGRVLASGATLPLQGEPRELGGHARDRYIYAPVAGTFRTALGIGDPVRAGQVIAHVGTTPLAAPLDGVLRGLTRDCVPVSKGTKVLEVDPRGEAAEVRGIGERPRRIAEAVVEAIHDWLKDNNR